MSVPIPPTIGRVVLYYPHGRTQKDAGEQPHTAMIAYVHSPTHVNIGYLDTNGVHCNATSVRLVQPGEELPQERYCFWMDYQQQQAKKHQLADETQRHNEALASVRPGD